MIINKKERIKQIEARIAMLTTRGSVMNHGIISKLQREKRKLENEKN